MECSHLGGVRDRYFPHIEDLIPGGRAQFQDNSDLFVQFMLDPDHLSLRLEIPT